MYFKSIYVFRLNNFSVDCLRGLHVPEILGTGPVSIAVISARPGPIKKKKIRFGLLGQEKKKRHFNYYT